MLSKEEFYDMLSKNIKDMSVIEVAEYISRYVNTDKEASRVLDVWLISNNFVQIVRCENCKFECNGQCNMSDNIVSPLGYCAWGEKK